MSSASYPNPAARTRLECCWVWLLCALVLSPGALGQEQDEDEAEGAQLAFQIYDTQAAAALVQDVRDHMAAQRWAEALTGLDLLLNEHGGEALGAQRHTFPGEPWRESLHAVHEGAASWAARTLLGLPESARELYQRRHGARADRALQQALSDGEVSGLSQVARRWPGTHQSMAAWWALGDLEIERGERDLGLQAWWRAIVLDLGHDPGGHGSLSRDPEVWKGALNELREQAGEVPLDEGLALRVGFALSHLAPGDDVSGQGLGPDQVAGVTVLSSERGSPDPGPAVDTWSEPHLLETGRTHPFKNYSSGKHSLYPVRLNDALYYSTSRRVHALDAFTGEELWSAPKDGLGWNNLKTDVADAFSEAIALQHSLVLPVASRGIVVAPLQVPRMFEDKTTYGDLEIIRIVPERRLFAFDAVSGEALWNHSPPPLWDGESGSFPHRMSVVGPPVASGSRLLVPSAMLRGRIEFHLACYDLHSGELLWNTPLVTGQRPNNMFGRLLQEFVAPPPVVHGDQVLMQTQLGAICSVDLFTGEVQWKSLYEQIPFTPGTYYNQGDLRSLWRNMPPIVEGNTVLAAPFDSPHLLGLDLVSGTVLWEASHGELNAQAGIARGRGVLDALVGAQGDRVYLAGSKVAAFQAPRGLDRQAPLSRAWIFPPINRLSSYSPLPVMTHERMYVPGLQDIDCLDLASGRLLESIPSASRPGNLLVGAGMLFNLSTYTLTAHFEWDHLLGQARERAQATPDDRDGRHAFARLLFSRGQAAMSDQDFRTAARFLEEARGELRALVENDASPVAGAYSSSLYEVLMAQARTQRLAADPLRALRFLREARPLAASRSGQRKALLEEQAILRSRDVSEWLNVLSILEREHADDRIDVVAPGGEAGAAEWNGRLIVVESSLAAEDAQPMPLAIPVGLWVAVERSQLLGSKGAAQELNDLHHILNRYAGVRLPSGGAWAWAADRIGQRLRVGASLGEIIPEYAPFEKQAQVLLEKALTDGDRSGLKQIAHLFPHSKAARRASEERISLVRAEGNVAELADIILTPLSDNWSPQEATASELHYLLQLAQTLGENGNLELRAAWMSSLARRHPNLSLDLTGEGPRSLSEWAADPAWLAPDREPSPVLSATFDSTVEVVDPPSYKSMKTLRPVGQVPMSLAPLAKQDGPRAETVNLYCDGSRLYAISSDSAPQTSWRHFFDRPEARAVDALPSHYWNAIATSPGRVHAASIGSVATLDRETGELLWRWTSGTLSVVALDCISGVVVVREHTSEPSGRYNLRLTGLDAASGAKLWSFWFDGDRYHARPVLGEEHLVLLPKSSGTGRIFDLFTGRHVGQFQLTLSTLPTAKAAWIEEGRLILPNFLQVQRPAHNHVLALDLDSGEQAWRVTLSETPAGDMELLRVISHGDEHFLHLSPLDTSARSLQQAGLFELNTSLGALANSPLARLNESDRLVGLELEGTRTVLDVPYVFAMGMPASRHENPYLRALHLPHGERWSTRLPESMLRATGSMPLPAVSGSTVALAYKKPTGAPGSIGREASLVFLDRRSGRILATKPMSPDMWRTSESGLFFSVLDDALIVSGARKMDFMR
ncbi:MAG TPA: PQQ-binding-like beta-propeller repeat protein [Planctomycetota bacterium]|nr:PQQ-binding-like beta-propeller repeat protein [Planctomycetota bacterium]